MQSTTDRPTADGPDRRGQTLVIFVVALLGLLSVMALALDAGQMLLDRRAQQDAADAAALAGARYLIDPANPRTSEPCSSPTSASYCRTAVDTAVATAATNGYSAERGASVTVVIPPVAPSAFEGKPGHIQVRIATNRPSIVGAILGFLNFPVSATATAANYNGPTLNASLLALNPTECQSAQFNGNGAGAGVYVGSDIQVDSSCPVDESSCAGTNPANSAFSAGGNSTVQVTSSGGAINVVGCPYVGGSADVDPTPLSGRPYMPDPFAAIPAPTAKPVPAPARLLGDDTATPPDGCPGSDDPATEVDPQLCTFNTAGQIWVLSPGYYPGGLQVQKGTVYLQPGIYFIGGGGFKVLSGGGNQAFVYSVPAGYSATTPPFTASSGHAACDTDPVPSPSPCGGVMIYNSEDEANGAEFDSIDLGGTGGFVGLYPIQQAPYKGIVIFQDRSQTLNNSGVGDITLQGGGTNLWVNGALYAPSGFVNISGSGTIGSSVQVIADTFFVTGSGSLNIPFSPGIVPRTYAVGLVE